MNKESIKNICFPNLNSFSFCFAFVGLASILNPTLKADQIANSSVDLKKDIENIKQKDFKDKNNLDSTFDESQNEQKKNQEQVSEKTIFLKEINLVGNKKFSDKKLLSFFKGLLKKDVTFSELSNASLKFSHFIEKTDSSQQEF